MPELPDLALLLSLLSPELSDLLAELSDLLPESAFSLPSLLSLPAPSLPPATGPLRLSVR